MLRVNYRDLRSGKIVELKPHSFVQLLRYVEPRLPTKPKLLRKTIASQRVTHQGSSRTRWSNSLNIAPTSRNILTVFLIMVVIYIVFAYLRALLNRATEWARACMIQYLEP